MHKLPFKRRDITASILDIWGPTPVSSIFGHKYYVSFTDAFSHFVWLYPLKQKLEALLAFSFVNSHPMVNRAKARII